ncbi:hypothetical protein [Terriglobus albidus]|uniref:hypothetical protein n=1 Tax=Terriglobus albidus TaxID=1592106 RepID=UPI0021E0B086|nr:hypothetical protein [Terriglobus albidus]
MPKTVQSLGDILEEHVRNAVSALERVAPEETKQLLLAQAALSAYKKQHVEISQPVAGLPITDNAYDAIKAYLRMTGKPQSKEFIIETLLQSGFQAAKPRRELNLKDSFRWHLSHPDESELREIDGKVGLKSWVKRGKFSAE